MPMYNPPHPGESLREALDNTDWTVTECAARLGVARNTLSRVLKRTGRHLCKHGVGAGTDRVEQR